MDARRIEAAKLGKTRFIGATCKKHGESERYVSSGDCVACIFERIYRRRKKERDMIRAIRSGQDHDFR